MQAIIDACRAGQLVAQPAIVISNNSRSGALMRAIDENIDHCHLSAKTHPDFEALDQAICQALDDHQIHWLILAGYMKKLGPKTLSTYRGRVLNIHPSLLPKYGGQGMYGKKVHEAVLASGDSETGVTVHLVDGEYDTGPIVAQCRVPVEINDTVDSLAQRVLKREHTFFVETLNLIFSGELIMPKRL